MNVIELLEKRKAEYQEAINRVQEAIKLVRDSEILVIADVVERIPDNRSEFAARVDTLRATIENPGKSRIDESGPKPTEHKTDKTDTVPMHWTQRPENAWKLHRARLQGALTLKRITRAKRRGKG